MSYFVKSYENSKTMVFSDDGTTIVSDVISDIITSNFPLIDLRKYTYTVINNYYGFSFGDKLLFHKPLDFYKFPVKELNLKKESTITIKITPSDEMKKKSMSVSNEQFMFVRSKLASIIRKKDIYIDFRGFTYNTSGGLEQQMPSYIFEKGFTEYHIFLIDPQFRISTDNHHSRPYYAQVYDHDLFTTSKNNFHSKRYKDIMGHKPFKLIEGIDLRSGKRIINERTADNRVYYHSDLNVYIYLIPGFVTEDLTKEGKFGKLNLKIIMEAFERNNSKLVSHSHGVYSPCIIPDKLDEWCEE